MGYIGQRMSERAAEAYDMGEKPFSKWTKSDIIERLQKLIDSGDLESSEEDMKRIKRLTSKTVKYAFLKKSSWHHTGKYFKETDFYDITDDFSKINLDDLDQIDRYMRSKMAEAKIAKCSDKYAIITYYWTENRGSKKWARIYECQQNFLAKIKGKAAIIAKGWQKDKKVYNYSIVHEFEGKPRKNAKEFKLLENSYRESKRSKWYNY